MINDLNTKIQSALNSVLNAYVGKQMDLHLYNSLKYKVNEFIDQWRPVEDGSADIAQYIIIDLEATTWNDPNRRHEMEIIEIGAVVLSQAFTTLSHFQYFVRPVRNPILSDFCKSLTHISQENVDCADVFPIVMEKFIDDVKNSVGKNLNELVFCSWGNFDKHQFQKDCTYNSVKYPFGEHRNLSEEFKNKYGRKKSGLRTALNKLGMEFEGAQHRALDDTINIARIFVKENKNASNSDSDETTMGT